MFAPKTSKFNEISYGCMSIYTGALAIAGFTGNLPSMEGRPYDPAIAAAFSAMALAGAVASRAERRQVTKVTEESLRQIASTNATKVTVSVKFSPRE